MEDTVLLVISAAPVQTWPTLFWGVVIAAAIGCCIGFKEFIWFISCGYGFAIMAIGLFLLGWGVFSGTLTLAKALLAILFVVYGFRLGYFTLSRELKNANYKKTLDSTGSTKKTPIFVSLFMWAYGMFDYAFQTSAVAYRFANYSADNIFAYLGIIIMAVAIYGEALADKQKSAAKAINPKRFCDTGLYKYCRCPNYFCEILFWVGVTVSGIGAVEGKQWIIALIGLALIIFIMYDGAKRLELRHEKNYGLDPEYQRYSDTVPLLFPFTKMYHSMKVYRD